MKKKNDLGSGFVREHITFTNSVKFSYDDISRVYGKIAFNVLAKLKGQEFVLDSIFDSFVSAINTGKEIGKYVSWPETEVSGELKDFLHFGNDEHFVFIKHEDNELQGVVNLYGNKGSVMVRFCDEFRRDFESCGYICDWMNKKEWLLEDYLNDAMQKGKCFIN